MRIIFILYHHSYLMSANVTCEADALAALINRQFQHDKTYRVQSTTLSNTQLDGCEIHIIATSDRTPDENGIFPSIECCVELRRHYYEQRREWFNTYLVPTNETYIMAATNVKSVNAAIQVVGDWLDRTKYTFDKSGLRVSTDACAKVEAGVWRKTAAVHAPNL